MAYLVKRGKYYHLYYYDNALGKIKTRSLKTKDRAEARRKLKEFIARRTLNLNPDNFIPKDEYRLTLTDALEMYFASRKLSPKTERAYRIAIKRLIGITGNTPIANLTPQKYLEFITILNSEDLSRNSIANYTRHIYALFSWLEKQKIIKENPVIKTKPEKKEPHPFDTSDLQKFFELLRKKNKKYYDAVKLIYLVAYRIGEFTRAEWSDFDFENEIIYVRNTKGNATVILMLKDTREHLESSSFPREGKISRWSRPENMQNFWIAVKAKTGLNFGMHALRKARGTDLANAGANPFFFFFLQKYMRHEEIKITLQYYVKIDIAKAKAQLNSVL